MIAALGVVGAGALATSLSTVLLHPSVDGALQLMNPGSVPSGVSLRLRLLHPPL